MDIKNILLEKDFDRLSNDDISKLSELLEANLSTNASRYLYNQKDFIFSHNKEAREYIFNKIFCGKLAVKWYTINGLDNTKKDIIKNKINTKEYYENILAIDPNILQSVKCYTCVLMESDRYLFRFLVPDGEVSEDNGMMIERRRKNKNVIVVIDLEDNFIEVRSDYRTANKVITQLRNDLELDGIEEHHILTHYGVNIEKFMNALEEARFRNVKSIPTKNVELTADDTSELVHILETLDEYFINNNAEKLLSEMQSIEFETEGLMFTQLLLSGMEQIGISVRKDCIEDMCSQPMYRLLENYITNQSAYISFKNINDEQFYTIQIGFKTNSINFRSDVTEDVIEYIRNKELLISEG